MRRFVIGLLALALVVPAAAQATTHPALTAVHHWAAATQGAQRARGLVVSGYHWTADRHSTTEGERWHIAVLWHNRYVAAVHTAAVNTGFPLACVAMAEEGGGNSIDGYYGFVYPPSDYSGGSGYSSWLAVPKVVQDHVAILEYQRYGGGAWGPLTREKCGI